MTPLVTLHHFTDPLWLYEQGGWENDDTPALFEKFVRKVVDSLRGYVTTWVPINEPNVYVYGGYLGGGFPPGKNDTAAAFRVMANMLRGHALAYRAIKSIQREARVGAAINVRAMRPAHNWSPADKKLASMLAQNFNASFLDALSGQKLRFAFKSTRVPEAAGTQDFVGINYYTTDLVAFRPLKTRDFFNKRFYPSSAPLSDTGFIAHVPEGLYTVLKWAKDYQLPILITENGVEDADDHLRPRYLVEHLHQLWRAIQFNWPVKGYFHWSLIDNFEWERGWSQRFGLWGLDVDTQARIRRPSVDLYAAICQQNALSSDRIIQYAPESLDSIIRGRD
jgi:beta-glucosidase